MGQPAADKGRKRSEVRSDYSLFVEKFKPKKTTDDCHTPEAVYEAVLGYCRNTFDLEGKRIARPFWPDGDYRSEAYGYDSSTVVVDNPPFSIFTEIRRFYLAKGIPYFLFGPALTLFSGGVEDSKICTGVTVRYANGAMVSTSFVTNLFDTPQVRTEPSLYRAIRVAQRSSCRRQNTLSYPANVITSAMLSRLSRHDEEATVIPLQRCAYIPSLDAQRAMGRSIFGGGYLIPDREAEPLARRTNAADFTFSLSERERAIVQILGSKEREA